VESWLRVAAVAECDIESAATDDAAATTKWRRLNLVGVDRLVLILISSVHEVGDISNVIATSGLSASAIAIRQQDVQKTATL
jgi:hypothetical protein